jgi:hypothetical protein
MTTTKTTKTTKGEDPTFEIIGCAIEVHRLLGAGFLESAQSVDQLQRSPTEFRNTKIRAPALPLCGLSGLCG